MKKVGIIGAMEEEVALIKENLLDIRDVKHAHLTFYTGKLCNQDVVLVRSGIGKTNAALCAQILISEFKATNIINTGVAGAIDKRLHMYDFVLSTDAVHHDFNATAFGYKPTVIPRMDTSVFEADELMRQRAKKAFAQSHINTKVYEGRIASGDQFIASNEQKRIIEKNCFPMCVEMEGAAVAQVCHVNDTPYLIIRCIADMANESTEPFAEKKAGEMSAQFIVNLLS